jgi:hypothetical protein
VSHAFVMHAHSLVFCGVHLTATSFVCIAIPGGSSGSTSIFRAFRLLRVLRLAKSINSLRVLLSTVVESFGNVAYMTLLLFLFVFMFAVMGVQGAALCFPHTSPVLYTPFVRSSRGDQC